MPFKTFGITVEGITTNPFGNRRPTLWAYAATSGGVNMPGGGTAPVEGKGLVDAPAMAASKLDPLTGEVSSGALQIQLHASLTATRAFLAQARARRPAAVLQADAAAGSTILDLQDLSGSLSAGVVLHLAEELIYLQSSAGGTLWNVSRGYADTLSGPLTQGLQAYLQPSYWAGRAVTLYECEIDPALGNQVVSTTTLWRGYLTEAPALNSGGTTLSLKADDILQVLRRARVNRAPLPHGSDLTLTPYAGTTGPQVYGQIEPDGRARPNSSVRKLDTPWLSTGVWKAMQVGESVVLTRLSGTVTGLAVAGSPPLTPEEPLQGPFWELALWDRRVDAWIAVNYPGEPGVSPTINCAYPYHPLTIAAALLFSSQQVLTEDPATYDVLHPNFSLGVPFLADYAAWDLLIEATNHLTVDRVVLGWDAAPTEVYAFVTQQLLPAYGFALRASTSGLLSPIQVGLADLTIGSTAPERAPISGKWEWTPGVMGALDAILATVGATPWNPAGRTIEIQGQGVRDVEPIGRATRLLNRAETTVNYPTISAEAAEQYATTELLNRLVWRYDGLPVVSCWLDAQPPLSLGDWVRLVKPDGLVSPILFDRDGNRVDTLWGQAALLGQVVSLRLDLARNRYEVALLLANYSYGAVARWRAPAARIKSRPGIAQYVIEGPTSDFGEAVSDALSLTVGDEVTLRNRSLGYKGGTIARTVTLISPSGSDWLITLNSDFGAAGVAGDWIYLGTSPQYSNNNVVPGEDYPYVFMTTAATLVRPGGLTTDPDYYS